MLASKPRKPIEPRKSIEPRNTIKRRKFEAEERSILFIPNECTGVPILQ